MKRLFSFCSISFGAACFTLFAFPSCNNSNSHKTEASLDSASLKMTIVPASQSPDFPDAQLSVASITAMPKGKDSAAVTIHYKVENYTLTAQTDDAGHKGCSNSKNGQHIHFILNGAPYQALYKPENTFMVPLNQAQYLVSFLSRSYHESVKNPNAGFLYHFSVDQSGKVHHLPSPDSAMIFYSRPKGVYTGKDADKVLLDFYVYNAQLGQNTLVKATVNDTIFTIDHWQAYFIEHAPMGDLNISLQLTDTSGNPLSGAFTAVSRKAVLKK